MQLRNLMMLGLACVVFSFSYLPAQAQDNDRGDRRDQRDHHDRVPDWLVGRFKGYNRKYKVNTTLTIRRDGDVTSFARFDSGKRSTGSGTYRHGQLRMNTGTFDVEQARDGIRLIQTTDRSNRAIYHKAD